MVKFRCPNCSQKLSVPENRAGRAARCPRCKERIAIPYPAASESMTAGAEDELTLVAPPKLHDGAALDLDEPRRLAEEQARTRQSEEELLASLGVTPPPEHTGKRTQPWPIDILLYPINVHGLVFLAICVGIPTCLRLVFQLVPLLGFAMGIPVLILHILIFLYAGWYLAECVFDSATGGTRAPGVPTAGIGEMWSRVSYFLAVYVLFLFPPGIYYLFTRETDLVFYGLLVWTILFFPMGLLAMAIMDSTTALNPLVLLDGILRTFFSYVGLLVLLVAVTFLMGWLLNTLTGVGPALLSTLIGHTGSYCALMVQAHILGRFHWRNREKLDWGI